MGGTATFQWRGPGFVKVIVFLGSSYPGKETVLVFLSAFPPQATLSDFVLMSGINIQLQPNFKFENDIPNSHANIWTTSSSSFMQTLFPWISLLWLNMPQVKSVFGGHFWRWMSRSPRSRVWLWVVQFINRPNTKHLIVCHKFQLQHVLISSTKSILLVQKLLQSFRIRVNHVRVDLIQKFCR